MNEENETKEQEKIEEEKSLIIGNKNPCEGCIKCCSYVVTEIDKPVDKDDFENIRWYLVHKNVSVFIDHDDSWNLEFSTPCEKLDEKGWCSIYEKRPQICRNHKSDDCERNGDYLPYKILFKNIDEFEDWMRRGKKVPK